MKSEGLIWPDLKFLLYSILVGLGPPRKQPSLMKEVTPSSCVSVRRRFQSPASLWNYLNKPSSRSHRTAAPCSLDAAEPTVHHPVLFLLFLSTIYLCDPPQHAVSSSLRAVTNKLLVSSVQCQVSCVGPSHCPMAELYPS